MSNETLELSETLTDERTRLLSQFLIASSVYVSATSEAQRAEDLTRVNEVLDGYALYQAVEEGKLL